MTRATRGAIYYAHITHDGDARPDSAPSAPVHSPEARSVGIARGLWTGAWNFATHSDLFDLLK